MQFDARTIPLRDGRVCTLRPACPDDAAALIEYMTRTAGETEFILRYPDEISYTEAQERELLENILKDPGHAMMIGIVEVLKVGQQIIEANRKSSPNAAFGVFATVFLLYFLACYPISLLSRYLEKKANG